MLYISIHHTSPSATNYSFGPVWAFFRMGSILVAFMTSPLTFSFPLMNSLCALALPAINCWKSESLNTSVTLAFLPSGATPLPTVPVSLRSMCQDSVLPSLFLMVNAKTALPFLMASFRPASSD